MTEYKYNPMQNIWVGSNGVVITDEFFEHAKDNGWITIGHLKTDKINGGFIKNIDDSKLVSEIAPVQYVLPKWTDTLDLKTEYYTKKNIGKLFNYDTLKANIEHDTPVGGHLSVEYLKVFSQELPPWKYKLMYQTIEQELTEWKTKVFENLKEQRKAKSSKDFLRNVKLNEYIDVRIEIDINGQFIDQLTFYNRKTNEAFSYVLTVTTPFELAWDKHVVPVFQVWLGRGVNVALAPSINSAMLIAITTPEIELRFDINPHKIKLESAEQMIRQHISNLEHVELAVFLAKQKIEKLVNAAKYTASESLSGLARQLPGVRNVVKHPVHGTPQELFTVIINLNDHHKWSGDAIADWIESLDEVPVFEPVEREPNSNARELPEIAFVGCSKRFPQGTPEVG